MLDSRYLYLHEALGLGPMWLSQTAHLHQSKPESNSTPITATQAQDTSTKTHPDARISVVNSELHPAINDPESTASHLPTTDHRLSTLQNILGSSQTVNHTLTPAPSQAVTDTANIASQLNQVVTEQILKFEDIPAAVAACTRCSLHQERCAPIVGHGAINARLLVITPNPAPLDDTSQQLFSGEAGKLLSNMLAAINIGADEVFYTSQVKCAPNISLRITQEQIKACLPALKAQIEQIKPRAILLLGQVFKQLEEQSNLQQYLNHIPYVIAPHPARLLRQSHLKASAWAALKILHKFLQ